MASGHADRPRQLVTRTSEDGLDTVTVSRAGFDKIYITAHARDGVPPSSMFRELSRAVEACGASIVTQYVFGGCELHEAAVEAIRGTAPGLAWPLTWIEADGHSGSALTGTLVYAVRRAQVTPIRVRGHVVGSVFEDADATYCLLGDLRPDDLSRPKPEQAWQAFEKMETALAACGMAFSHVVRTWLYLDDLLTWYDEFNAVRTRFFRERGVFSGLVPASTGIGVSNPAGAALITDAFAVRPKHPGVRVYAVPSPLQCPALDYKSSFSRAVEIALPDCRRLLISGSASIAPGGETEHVGDVPKQVDLTMRVVEAILASRGMGWADVTRGIAYFKDIKDVGIFRRYCAEHGPAQLPVALAHADICRDDLLFEIEVDAITVGPLQAE